MNSQQKLSGWFVPLGVVAAGVLPLAAVQLGVLGLTGNPLADFVLLIGVLELVFYVWVRALSKWPLGRQALVLVLFVSAQAVLLAMCGWKASPATVGRCGPGAGGPRRTKRSPPVAVARRPTAIRRSPTAARRRSRLPGIPRGGPLRPGRRRELEPRLEVAAAETAVAKGGRPRVVVVAIAGDYGFTQEQRGDWEATVCYELPTAAKFGCTECRRDSTKSPAAPVHGRRRRFTSAASTHSARAAA